MEVAFKKDPRFKYVCRNCGKQFNWNKLSRRYGKHEYRTITEKQRIDRIFCSHACYIQYFKTNKKPT